MLHPVGSYCTDISQYMVNKTLKKKLLISVPQKRTNWIWPMANILQLETKKVKPTGKDDVLKT